MNCPRLIYLCFLICLCTHQSIGSNISVLFGECNEAYCNERHANEDSPQFRKDLLKLISSGPMQLLLEQLSDGFPIQLHNVTAPCRRSVMETISGMEQLDEWAFRLLDSSAKTPAAFLESTVSSIGDYDECLAVSSGGQVEGQFNGKYCMVDMFAQGPPSDSYDVRPLNGQLIVKSLPIFRDSSFIFGLCFPSTCQESDVRQFVAFGELHNDS